MNIEAPKASPAPWTATGREVTCRAFDRLECREFDATVADCFNEADARLIAAAPELLEALQNCMAMISRRYAELTAVERADHDAAFLAMAKAVAGEVKQ